MDREISTIEIRGKKIRVLRGGPDNPAKAEPLLYLHGAAMENEFWLPFLSALADRYELHAPSHPGFLDSEGIDDITSIDGFVDHYRDYIDAMGWKSVNIVGLSFGGWIAAELATRHPSLVKNLVLVDAAGIWIKDRPITDVFAIDAFAHPERVRNILFADPGSALAMMAFPDPGLDGKPRFPPDEVLLKTIKAFAALAKVSWNPLLHNPELEKRLHRIEAKTLIVWGEQDGLVPVAYGEKYARLIPAARLQLVDGAGHLPPLEQPERFVTALRDFLG